MDKNARVMTLAIIYAEGRKQNKWQKLQEIIQKRKTNENEKELIWTKN